jgi:hypothetical protein
VCAVVLSVNSQGKSIQSQNQNQIIFKQFVFWMNFNEVEMFAMFKNRVLLSSHVPVLFICWVSFKDGALINS